MSAPLTGITILDFTRYQQGPYATVMLADMGADVIKVEERSHGDLGRALGRQPDGFCAYFEAHNRGKRSMTLDVRTEAGRNIVHQLVERVDVVTENFRPGVMDRLGIGYETLSAINPRLIMASASGAGQKGPQARKPSYDVIGQAAGGMMVAQGGGPNFEPQMVTAGFADHVGAMFLAYGVAMALIARERDGLGQHVDASLLSGQIAFQSMGFYRSLRVGEQASFSPGGNPVFRPYRCGDNRWVAIGVLDPKVFAPLCRALGRDDLLSDERFREPFVRAAHAIELTQELGETFASQPSAHWLKRLEECDVPASLARTHVEVGNDPHVIENEFVVEKEHPHLGTLRIPGIPVKLSRTPGAIRSHAPELGQNTEEVLLDLGYEWEEIEKLRTDGVI
jgi:crotonobetainyl-CoA:carnitine CoA-transferase CaiB-like acyl-CoA transferase